MREGGLAPGCNVVACRCDAFLGMREGGLARLGARSVVCPWGFREFGLGGEERGGRGWLGAAWRALRGVPLGFPGVRTWWRGGRGWFGAAWRALRGVPLGFPGVRTWWR